MKRFPLTSLLVLTSIACVTMSAYGQNFNNSSNVNVLRQYAKPAQFLVTDSETNTGGEWSYGGHANDGSGAPDDWILSSSQSATGTFVLPAPTQVASYSVLYPGNLPGSFALEGLVSGVWTPLASQPTVAGEGPFTGSFAPKTVTSLRYTITGVGDTATFAGVENLKVFMPTGQTVSYGAGYDFSRDAITGSAASTTGGSWNGITGSSAASLVTNGGSDYLSNVRDTTDGTSAFVAYTLDSPAFMNLINLGFYNGQSWDGGYSVYTASGAVMPATQSLTVTPTDIDTPNDTAITTAGWVYQYSSAATTGQDKLISFANPGDYQYVLIAWNATGGSIDDVELFGVPEPASAAILGLGGLLILRRRVGRRSSRA